MIFPRGRRRWVAIRHFSTISKVLIKHGLGELAQRLQHHRRNLGKESFTAWPDSRRIRRVFEDLGPSFIKLGQLMSTRADMLPPEYIQELSKLQDHVPPVSFDQILPVIEQALGKPWQEVFSSIASDPLAAASVAQVHLAVLKSGEQVAIKVVRPGIEKRIRKDIQLMRYVALRLEKKFEPARAIGAVNVVEEFERIIFRELDMQIEAGHIERFGQDFKDYDDIYIPKVYWPFSGKSVLVMEHIPGIKMDRVDEIVRHGIDPQHLALIGLRCFSRQLLETGIFHADPHPGNVIVMYDGRVSLVDFGIVGYLDEDAMLQIANVFLGFAEHDYEMVLEAFTAAGVINEQTMGTMGLEAFRNDLIDLSEPFYGRSLANISVREVFDHAMRLVQKHHIRLPRNLLLLLKTFIQTESLGKILDSDASLLEVTRPYARRLVERGYETRKLLRNLGRDFKSAGGYLRWMPKLTHDVFKRLAGGEMHIALTHGGVEKASSKFEKGLNRLTIGLVVSASIIAASLILNSSQTGLIFTFNFFGAYTISITQLLGLIGYGIATLLGLWLVFSIIRSGKL